MLPLVEQALPARGRDVHPNIMRAAQLRCHKPVADQRGKERYFEPVRQNQRFGAAVGAACQQSKCQHALSSCRWQLPSSTVFALDRQHALDKRRGQRTNEFPDLSVTTAGENCHLRTARSRRAGWLMGRKAAALTVRDKFNKLPEWVQFFVRTWDTIIWPRTKSTSSPSTAKCCAKSSLVAPMIGTRCQVDPPQRRRCR